MKQVSLNKVAVGFLLLFAGMVVGVGISTSNVATGEVRTTAPPTAFQSGGQMSVPVLKEIAATLHQIDSRLARLETVAQNLQTKSTTK